MHLPTGIVDSSGIEFFYTSTRRQHNAAILIVGHHITPSMMIPPRAEEFIVAAECSSQCTSMVSIGVVENHQLNLLQQNFEWEGIAS
jgi:hypothetical protein